MENLKRDLENNFTSNPYNVEVLESKSEDLLLLAYKQLEIRAKNKCGLKEEFFLNCLKQTNEFNAKPDEKSVTLKFTNFTFDFNITDNDLAEQLSKIGIYYEDCKFKNYEFENYEFKTIKFENCTFEKINFRNCRFNGEFYFKKCTAKEADFSLIEFTRNTYFNNTTFENYADFHEAEFEAVACFYGATFEKPMNFSSVIFKDFNKANFVNLNIEKINFESIETKLNDMFGNGNVEFAKKSNRLKMIDKWIADSKKDKEYIEINDQYLTQKKEKLQREELEKNKKIKSELENKISWANNFRDSFRVIKHSLIETNNNLEASNFHKLELYAKEIELEYKIELENLNIRNLKTDKNNKKEQNKWKALEAFVDFNLLSIYRNTSEHHTSFTRILNFTITMIALFGIFIFISKISNLAEKVSLFMFFNILISFLLLTSLYQFGNTYKNSLFWFCCIFMILPALIFIPELFFKSNIINQCKIIYNNRIVITIGLFYLLILTLVVYWYKNRYFRTLTSFISYPIFFIILYFSVSLIIPFANLNSQDFKTKYLENDISQANKIEIVNLASVINPEFKTTKNPNSSENLSISELNEYKKFIVENKENLNKKLDDEDKFKQAIYADSSRDKTIKCISFIYAIILGLCLYSLQKTARRNSVVPS